MKSDLPDLFGFECGNSNHFRVRFDEMSLIGTYLHFPDLIKREYYDDCMISWPTFTRFMLPDSWPLNMACHMDELEWKHLNPSDLAHNT